MRVGRHALVDRRRQHPRPDMADDRSPPGGAGRRLHARDGDARRASAATRRSRRSARSLPYEPTLARVDRASAPIRRRASSRSPSPRPATTSIAQDRLDLRIPTSQADLARREPRATIYGAVAAILRARMRRAAGAVTLLNCDNLRHNGDALPRRAARLPRAPAARPRCATGWRSNTTCPNAMVDRITPRPPPDVAERVKAATGWDDAAPVMAESFIQWVIEDHFGNGRPAWERVGVEMVGVGARPTRKRRSASSTRATAASPGPARCAGSSFIHEGTRDAGDPRDRLRLRDRRRDPLPATARRIAAPSISPPTATSCSIASATPPSATPTSASRWTASRRSPASSRRRCASDSRGGESIASVAMLPALFLAFLASLASGELPYAYQDRRWTPRRRMRSAQRRIR